MAVAGAMMVASLCSDASLATSTGDQQRLLAAARQQATAAAARAARLEAEAARERDEARQARAQEAAVAARIQQTEADIAAGQARVALLRRAVATQRARLAAQQAPIARLVAALQSLARRPTMIALVQPGAVSDIVHVRAVLSSALPVIRKKTAALRTELARARSLERSAAVATEALTASRIRLEEQRLTLTRLEASHRLRSRALGRDALFESDRAIALGERARDIVDLMDRLSDQASEREALAALPGPLPRPPRPGETQASIGGMPSWTGGTPPYRLPATGRIVTGFGELGDNGVRSRGLTLAVPANAQAVAPATGRIAYAAPFRNYGMVVIIDHGGGWSTLVAGLSRVSRRVGDQVAQGQSIGRAGAGAGTGSDGGSGGGADSGDGTARLTVELRRKGRPVDIIPLTG